MKQPNDVKRKNPSTPSLGRMYGRRSVLVWNSATKGTRDLGRNAAKRAAKAAGFA